jgi:hypothetical protein
VKPVGRVSKRNNLKSKAEIADDNRLEGKVFEDLFFKHAQMSGLLALKNHLQAKATWGGNFQVIKSDLDYRLITQDGRVGYFDCKSFKKDFFIYSELKEAQVTRAALYNEWNVPSGFVVFFREKRAVCFYTGLEIAAKGERSRFSFDEGQILGGWENFDLKLLFGH